MSAYYTDSRSGIYGLFDRRDGLGTIRYVGLAKDLAQRGGSHRTRSSTAVSTPLARWKRAVGVKNVELVVLRYCDVEQLGEVETEIIARLRALGQPLLNVHAGGTTGGNRRVTQETIDQARALFVEGWTVTKIATALGIGIDHVYRDVQDLREQKRIERAEHKRAERERRAERRAERKRQKMQTSERHAAKAAEVERKKEHARVLLAAGHPRSDIAKRLAINPDSIYGWLPLTDEERAEAAEQHARVKAKQEREGFERAGRMRATIRTRVIRAEAERKRKAPRIEREVLRGKARELIRMGYSKAEIAEMLGMPVTLVPAYNRVLPRELVQVPGHPDISFGGGVVSHIRQRLESGQTVSEMQAAMFGGSYPTFIPGIIDYLMEQGVSFDSNRRCAPAAYPISFLDTR